MRHMQISFTIKDDGLRKNLKRFSTASQLNKHVRKALFKVATQLRKDLFQWTPQDTRQLLDSWETRWKGIRSLEAGYNEVYAMYQELGRRQDGSNIIRNRPAGGKTNYFKETIEDNHDKYIKIFEESFFSQLFK